MYKAIENGCFIGGAAKNKLVGIVETRLNQFAVISGFFFSPP